MVDDSVCLRRGRERAAVRVFLVVGSSWFWEGLGRLRWGCCLLHEQAVVFLLLFSAQGDLFFIQSLHLSHVLRGAYEYLSSRTRTPSSQVVAPRDVNGSSSSTSPSTYETILRRPHPRGLFQKGTPRLSLHGVVLSWCP